MTDPIPSAPAPIDIPALFPSVDNTPRVKSELSDFIKRIESTMWTMVLAMEEGFCEGDPLSAAGMVRGVEKLHETLEAETHAKKEKDDFVSLTEKQYFNLCLARYARIGLLFSLRTHAMRLDDLTQEEFDNLMARSEEVKNEILGRLKDEPADDETPNQ